jgi:hypothetical protein
MGWYEHFFRKTGRGKLFSPRALWSIFSRNDRGGGKIFEIKFFKKLSINRLQHTLQGLPITISTTLASTDRCTTHFRHVNGPAAVVRTDRKGSRGGEMVRDGGGGGPSEENGYWGRGNTRLRPSTTTKTTTTPTTRNE